MARKRRQTLFVIFSGPQQHGGPGTRYIANDGTTTDLRSYAAKFYTWEEAKKFAEGKSITLDAAMTYIGQEDFTEFEIAMGHERR
jgi:hypothetical protein